MVTSGLGFLAGHATAGASRPTHHPVHLYVVEPGDTLWGIASRVAGPAADPRPVVDALPFRYMFAFPVDALLGRVSPVQFATGMAVALAWCGVSAAVSAAVWRRGTLQYTGVGM